MSAAASPTCTRSSRGALPHPAPLPVAVASPRDQGLTSRATSSLNHQSHRPSTHPERWCIPPPHGAAFTQNPRREGGCSLGPGAVEGGFESATPRIQGYADHACQRPTFASSQGAEGRWLQQRVGAGGRVASVCREPSLCALRDCMLALAECALQCTPRLAGHLAPSV